jgi:hypothetical protein
MSEIRDLEIIKNALNERYKRYYYLATAYENEIKEIRSKPTVVEESKEIYQIKSMDSMISSNQLKEQIAV